MALSLKYGRGEKDERTRTEETYAKTREFMDRFKAKHSSVLCREIIGCDLLTEAGQKYFKENDLLHKTCAKCVCTAGEILEELL